MNRIIKKVIVHCSDSDDSLDFGFKDINEWHRQRGWLSPSGISCGYHFIIRRDGSIEVGRPIDEKGAHCEGQNSNSIGICWIGRNSPSNAQIKQLHILCKELIDIYKLQVTDVYGHKEFNPAKTCPNLDMDKFRAELLFI
jgi:N-acetylmuramoyl-L-alanine amidase